MTKKIISVFTFGLFLIVVGVIYQVMNKPQSSIIMAIGVLFETLAVLLYAWNKIKK